MSHRLLLLLAFAAMFTSLPASAADTLRDSRELETLQSEFPVLARLLLATNPWEQEPAALAGKLFNRPPKIAQGSAAYPLLFQDQRELGGWVGEKVFDQLSYETEYYAFDRARPVIKLHVGRPLTFAMQHGRIEARAASRGGVGQFPVLDPAMIPPLLERSMRNGWLARVQKKTTA